MVLKEFIGAGKVVPIVDLSFPMSEAPDAMRYLERGAGFGKVFLTV